MRITKIEPQKRRPGRKNIFADGQFVAGISDETLLRLALRTGDEIHPDTLKALQKTEELYHAKGVALRYLSSRLRTERELRDKLREKEFADDEISRTIGELRAAGLVNDLEFARMLIRDALALKPVGRSVLRHKLLLLGVEKSVTDQALEEGFASVDMQSIVLEAARQFMKRTRRSRKAEIPRKRRARLTSFLLRRGYSWDVIRPVINSILGSDDSDG